MISVSGKNWEEVLINKRILEKVKIDHNLSDIFAKIIISRNFSSSEIYSIENKITITNSFNKNEDFLISSKILTKHILKKNKILVIGDYDVDGCVSTSLMINFLNKSSALSSYYIPDRIKDGYGASLKLLKKLIVKEKPKLIIMLDCGSNANETIKYLNKLEIESIIIDHHNINKPYPKSSGLINPKKDCNYQNLSLLCSAFLTYLFLDYCIKKNNSKVLIKDNLIYVLIATITDVMPLREINRYLSINILKNFNLNKNFILKSFFDIHKVKKKLDIDDLGFFIGPILNSAGRINNADKVVKLLTTQKESTKKKIISELYNLNLKRKDIEFINLRKININKVNKKKEIIFIYNQTFPEGIIGILASRIKDYFNKPCVVFTLSGNKIKGSARSTPDFNIGEFIDKGVKSKILVSGGGHNLAAGVLLEKHNLEIFQTFLNNVYKKNNILTKNTYISKISPNSINKKIIQELDKIGPFGSHNLRPLFLIESVTVIKPMLIKEKFVSCYIKTKNSKLLKSISFHHIESKISSYLLNYKNEINIIARLKENYWNNSNSIQIEIIDLIINSNNT